MVVWLFSVTLILCFILGGLLWWIETTPPLLVVVLAGALGGFVSCLRRLYAFEDIFPRIDYVALFKKLNAYLIAYATIPPTIGAVADTVAYVVFAGEMIQGPLFPSFCCAPEGSGCQTLPDVMHHWQPAAAADYSRCVVWGFISGFSERFFVDILNQFGTKGTKRGAA